MSFLNSILGSGLSLGGSQRRGGYLKTLTIADLRADATTQKDVTTTEFNKLYQYAVPAQQEINYGFGSAANPDNQGFIYIKMYDDTATAAEEVGFIRLAASDANETKIDKVFEERTDRLNGSTTLRTQMIAFPEITNYPVLGRSPRQDDLLQLYMKSDAADKISPTATVLYIPVTVYS